MHPAAGNKFVNTATFVHEVEVNSYFCLAAPASPTLFGSEQLLLRHNDSGGDPTDKSRGKNL